MTLATDIELPERYTSLKGDFVGNGYAVDSFQRSLNHLTGHNEPRLSLTLIRHDGSPARLLLVERESALRKSLVESVEAIASVDACTTFHEARTRLFETSYDYLVTNLRLQAYNGLQLVYLAHLAALPRPRRLVYSGRADLSMAREVVRAGAFFELRDVLPLALFGFVNAVALPDVDRRRRVGRDRRATMRLGRRCSDAAPRPGAHS